MQNLETFEEYLAARKVKSSASVVNMSNSNGSSGHGSRQGSERSTSLGNPEANARARARSRARRNWRRAKYAVTRKITQDMLGVQRRCHILTV